jgi:hypothetical protein
VGPKSRRTLQRGLTSAATQVPVWFLQSAGARVDQWPSIGDYRPIFTEHVPEQFAWMSIRSPATDWLPAYLEKAGLDFSDAILSRYTHSAARQ